MNNEKKTTHGIYIEGSQNVVARENRIYGYDQGVSVINSSTIDLGKNTIVSQEVMKAFADTAAAIKQLEIADEEKNRMLACLEDVRSSIGKPDISSKYAAFISLMANHATLIAPILSVAQQVIQSCPT